MYKEHLYRMHITSTWTNNTTTRHLERMRRCQHFLCLCQILWESGCGECRRRTERWNPRRKLHRTKPNAIPVSVVLVMPEQPTLGIHLILQAPNGTRASLLRGFNNNVLLYLWEEFPTMLGNHCNRLDNVVHRCLTHKVCEGEAYHSRTKDLPLWILMVTPQMLPVQTADEKRQQLWHYL